MPSVNDAALALSGSVELSLVFKATLLLTMGLVAARLSSRSTAATRHLFLAATLTAVLALPLVVVAVPEITLPVPVRHANPAVELEMNATDMTLAPASAGGMQASTTPDPAQAWTLPSAARVWWFVWLCGAALFLLRLSVQLWWLARLRRTGLPALQMQPRLENLATRAGVRQSVTFLLHDDLSSPLTCGLARPVILLPRDAGSWSEDDLERALLHELEHIRRHDWAVQVVARIACAFYWFHPLAWISLRRLTLEAERACDDAVVVASDSTNYAQQLVNLAGRMSTGRMQPAIGMAHRSDLSTRVTAILDSHLRRGRAGSLTRLAVTAAVICVVFAMAPLRAVAQASPGDGALSSVIASRKSAGALDRALFESAERGDTVQMARLIRDGANVNAQLQGDGTPLIAAAREGHDEAVRMLLENDANPNLGIHGDGSPLIVAARERHLSTVRLLLQRGADIHMPVIGDGNPLIMAARGGSEEMVRFLLDQGANIEQVVRGDENALMEASASGYLPIVKLLVSRGANVNSRVWVEPQPGRPGEWRTPLNRARQHGHADIESYLRSVGAKE